MNKKDPKNPPNIVINCEEAKWTRYTCIAANSKTKREVASKQDAPVEIAVKE